MCFIKKIRIGIVTLPWSMNPINSCTPCFSQTAPAAESSCLCWRPWTRVTTSCPAARSALKAVRAVASFHALDPASPSQGVLYVPTPLRYLAVVVQARGEIWTVWTVLKLIRVRIFIKTVFYLGIKDFKLGVILTVNYTVQCLPLRVAR